MRRFAKQDGLSARRRIIEPLRDVARRIHDCVTPGIYGGLILAGAIIAAACHEQTQTARATHTTAATGTARPHAFVGYNISQYRDGGKQASLDTTRADSVLHHFTPSLSLQGSTLLNSTWYSALFKDSLRYPSLYRNEYYRRSQQRPLLPYPQRADSVNRKTANDSKTI